MTNLPSKELLGAVLNPVCILTHEKYKYEVVDNILYYSILGDVGESVSTSINIHELAHMVKEWALPIVGWLDSNLTNAIPSEAGTASFMSNDAEIQRFFAHTEPEAVFKAGEYILKELNND